MPWKNGGGQTIEVVISPATATLDDFDWRISMAHFATPGPFSLFPGIDRTLCVLGAHAVRLAVAGQPELTLDAHSAPFTFPGDVAVNAAPVGGAVDDLNMMSRRSRYRHRLTRHRMTAASNVPLQGETIIALPRGSDIVLQYGGSSVTAPDGDTVIFERTGAHSVEIAPRHRAEVYLIELWRCNASL